MILFSYPFPLFPPIHAPYPIILPSFACSSFSSFPGVLYFFFHCRTFLLLFSPPFHSPHSIPSLFFLRPFFSASPRCSMLLTGPFSPALAGPALSLIAAGTSGLPAKFGSRLQVVSACEAARSWAGAGKCVLSEVSSHWGREGGGGRGKRDRERENTSVYIYLSIHLFTYLSVSVCLSIHPLVDLYVHVFYLYFPLSFCTLIYVSICINRKSVYVSVFLSIYLFNDLYISKRL